MGYHLKIIAELNEWTIDETNQYASGIIHNSNDLKEFPEGQKYGIIHYKRLTHYPAYPSDPVAQPEHYLLETNLGNHFVLYLTERKLHRK